MKSKKQRILDCVKFVVALIGALLFFVPFVLVILNSVKPLGQIMTDLLGLPTTIMWENYVKAWNAIDMSHVLRNTVIVTFISVLLILLLSPMVAYWIVRHPTKFSRLFEKLLLGSLLIPFASLMLPLVKTVSALGLINSLWGGILTYVGIDIAFASFILSGAVRAIPLELEEAAMLDGCNVYQLFFGIVVPMLSPTLLSVFVLSLFWVWNDYIIALVMFNSPGLQTMQLAINKLFGLRANQWDVALPAIIMNIAPILVINVLMQKKIVSGVAAGAIKG